MRGFFSIVIFLISLCVLFLSSDNFVEKEVLPKECAFIFGGILFGTISILKNSLSLRLDRLAIFVLVFIFYLFFTTYFSSSSMLGCLSLLSFLLLFFFLKESKLPQTSVNYIILLLCMAQAIYGLSQYFKLTYTSSNFPIIGSYDNPAGFAACLAVAFPLILPFFKYSKLYKVLVLLAAITISGAIVLSESRAGIVSLIVVSIIFIVHKLPDQLKKYKKYIVLSLVIVGIIAVVVLIYLKKNSASGRLLVWNVTWNMIKDNPILGGGHGYFRANYMGFQADYFIQHPDSEYAMLGDNILHPFNEYLLLIAEYGIVGIALLIIGVIFLFKSSKISSPYMLCLISLGIFSLFSYPLKYPFTWVIVAYCIAQISRNNKPVIALNISTRVYFKSFILLGAFVGLSYLIRDIRFERRWNKVAKFSLLGKTKEMVLQYEKLYQSWNGNHLFLYNYGAELNHIKEYEKSIAVFNKCTLYWNDYDIQMLIADNYFNLESWHKAEQHYELASNMCPNRFAPLYKLHEIYQNKKEYHKAEDMAKEIVKKEIKIPSASVNSIVRKMEKYLNDN